MTTEAPQSSRITDSHSTTCAVCLSSSDLRPVPVSLQYLSFIQEIGPYGGGFYGEKLHATDRFHECSCLTSVYGRKTSSTEQDECFIGRPCCVWSVWRVIS